MENSGTWPEQNAVEKWFTEHSLELKKAVTEYRIKVQGENNKLKAENVKLRNQIESHAPEGHNYTNQQYQDLRTENDKLLRVVEAARDLLAIFCTGYSCFSKPQTLEKCERWCNTKEKYLLKKALAELDGDA